MSREAGVINIGNLPVNVCVHERWITSLGVACIRRHPFRSCLPSPRIALASEALPGSQSLAIRGQDDGNLI